MVRSNSSLETKIRETLCGYLRNGQKVVALKYYHEVTMTPLLESKQFIDSIQLDSNAPIGDEKFRQFLLFLDERDFGGAASRLLDDLVPSMPGDAIANTIRIAKLLDLDVTALELPSSVGIALSESPHAQAIVSDRALQTIRERMIQRCLRSGTSQEEAEQLVDDAMGAHVQGQYVPPNPLNVSLDGIDPQLARVVRLLLGPVAYTVNPPSEQKASVTVSPTQLLPKDKDSVSEQREDWFRRIGRLAALVYCVGSIVGIAAICYSYSTIPQLTPFSMTDELSLTDQSATIENWSVENMPANSRWFFSSDSDHFFPVRFEPGLPLAYAGEEWPWEKKIASINASANEIMAQFQRCHEVLIVLYSIAILIGGFHWFQRDIASGVLMVLLGVLGIPILVRQVWRWEFDNPLWLGPLLLPGVVALVASMLDLALVPPKTDRRKELRAFWLGTITLVISGLFLGWAILEGNHLRPGAGLGVFGGAWLMLHHGWRYLRNKN
jgi:hypothetical protein